MKPCVFCEDPSIRLREITRTERAWAFPTNIPITPGHVLICPVRHTEKFSDLTREEREDIFSLAERLKQSLKKLYGAEGFHEVWNEGEVAGQSVPHFHLHIVPRKKGDAGVIEYEPRKFLYRPGSREASPETELQALAKEITMHLDV